MGKYLLSHPRYCSDELVFGNGAMPWDNQVGYLAGRFLVKFQF